MRHILRAPFAAALIAVLAAPASPPAEWARPHGGPAGLAIAQVRQSAPPPPKRAPGAPPPAGPRLPTVQIGALLPLTGLSAWFGKEMRQGMELAIADLSPPQPRSSASAPPDAGPPGASPSLAPGEPETAPMKAAPSASVPGTPASAKAEVASPGSPPAAGSPGAMEALAPRPGFQLVLKALDVDPLDVKEARDRFGQLGAAKVAVVFTASVTPTLAVYPLAAAQDILLVHQGLVTNRFPSRSRVLVHTRPTLGARVDALAAHARERGVRRLALLAAGDEFGKDVRARLSARWAGGLLSEESLSLEVPDLRSRLRDLARRGPEAVVLAFRGADLGTLARSLRDAGYPGPLLALDADPSVPLAGGAALEGALLVTEAFVPAPDSPAARFANAYKAKFGTEPSRHAANAYEAVAIVANVLREAREAGGAIPGGARLREMLLARRSFPSLYGGRVVLREDGSLDRPFALFTVTQEKLDFVRYLVAPNVAAGAAGGAATPSVRRAVSRLGLVTPAGAPPA